MEELAQAGCATKEKKTEGQCEQKTAIEDGGDRRRPRSHLRSLEGWGVEGKDSIQKAVEWWIEAGKRSGHDSLKWKSCALINVFIEPN